MQETYGTPGVAEKRLGEGLWDVLFTPTDIIEIRGFHGDEGPRKRWFGTTSELYQRPEIIVANAEGFDLYQGVNPRPARGAGKNADITTCRTVCVDLDPGEGCPPVTIDEGFFLLAQSGLPTANAIIHSGSGLQVFWALSEPVDGERWRALQKGAISCFPYDRSVTHADACIHDPARVMRLPGTVNWKNGNTATVISMVPISELVSPPSAFVRLEAVPAPTPAPTPEPGQKDTSNAMRARLYVAKIPPAQQGERNSGLYKVCCIAHDFDLDDQEAAEIICEWNARCSPPLSDRELAKTVASAKAGARGERGAKNRPAPLPGGGGHGEQCGGEPTAATTTNHRVLDALARECALIIGTTQVWHEGLVMSMPVEALRQLYPIEGKVWLQAQDKRTVRAEDIVFEPNEAKVKPGQINLWRGLKITPDARTPDLLVAHILHLCCGDQTVFQWLSRWMAYPLHHPGAKMDTAVIMQGPQGTGKSMLWKTYREIFGEYGRKITQSTLDDPYTGWMSRKLCVVAEEVCSTRTQARKLRNLLKDWVTGESFEIREKYQIGRTERALANFAFLSNEDVPLPIDTGDRRFAVICQIEKREKTYFQALGAEIEDNGPARLAAWLLSLDLGDFDEHTPPPDTEAREQLKELCAHSYELFLDEWSVGDIPELPFVSGTLDDVYTAYQFWCKYLHGGFAESKRQLSKYLSGKLAQKRGDCRYFYVDSADTTRFANALKGFIRLCDARKL